MYKTEQHKFLPSSHLSVNIGIKAVLILSVYIFRASNYISLSCLSSEGVKRDSTISECVICEQDLCEIPKDVLTDATKALSNLQNLISSSSTMRYNGN